MHPLFPEIPIDEEFDVSMLSTTLCRLGSQGAVSSEPRGAILEWFSSLNDDELRLVCEWMTNERFAAIDGQAHDTWYDKVSHDLGMAVSERVGALYGFSEDYWDSEDVVASAKRPTLCTAESRLSKTLHDALTLRLRGGFGRARANIRLSMCDPKAAERLKELQLLVYRARLTSDLADMATVLAPSWTGDVAELFESAGALSV
jgi:hypothetical protein